MYDLKSIIVETFDKRAELTPRNVDTVVKDAITEVIDQLDRGEIRAAEKK
ncbi:MAG: 2,3,4,5-tetrahydropyridine-2,6-dicarboxylate N-succinyltransferase, partial [Sedimenticolaceae bacterium]